MPVPVHGKQKGEVDQGVAEREDEVDRQEWQKSEGQGGDKGETSPFALDALDQGRPGKEQEEGDVEGEDDLCPGEKVQLTPFTVVRVLYSGSHSRSGRLRAWETPDIRVSASYLAFTDLGKVAYGAEPDHCVA